MNPKVSVIVPIYNAETTLAACLGNLVHQTLADIEIILVNDASTDHSLQIMMDCEQQFSDKILLINLDQNRGPGGARNIGLSYASGDYIGFVDSDDLADLSMFETLYQLAEAHSYDIVDCAYYDQESDSLLLLTDDDCTGVLDTNKRSKLIAGGGYLWSKLFRRELFDGITFREHAILEDMEVLMQLFLKANSLGTTKTPLYQYSYSPASASKPKDPLFYHEQIIQGMRTLYNSFHSLPEYSSIQTAVEYSILHLYLGGIMNALTLEHPLSAQLQQRFLSDLHQLRTTMVALAYPKNPYFSQKFTKDQQQLLLDMDKKFS